jgi:hypothetical protein
MTNAASTRDQALAVLLAQKVQIEDNLMALKGACNSDVERAALVSSFTSLLTYFIARQAA